MAFTKVTYCSLEGTPAIVGRAPTPEGVGVWCYEYIGGSWREPADNGADIVTKAATMSQAAFERMFPGIGLPQAPA